MLVLQPPRKELETQMRVSEPVEDYTSSEAASDSGQENSSAEGGRVGSEAYTSSSDSEALQVRI